MSLNPRIATILTRKGYKCKQSASGKKLKKFDTSTVARCLWKYLSLHPSFRVVFNALVKSGGFDPNDALMKLPDLLRGAKTSFLFEAHCRNCKNILDRPNLLETKFKLPNKKEITCPKCNTRNIIGKDNYDPIFRPELKDLIKVFLKGCEEKVFAPSYSSSCYVCDNISPYSGQLPKDMKCGKCKSILYLSTDFAPAFLELRDLIQEKEVQGYWLEWYVYRLINKEFISEIGLEITKGSDRIECDLFIIQNGKTIVIECKDTNDESFIKKLSKINKVADHYILVTTFGFNQTVIDTVKEILKDKLICVQSNNIENLIQTIKRLR